jgi:hypothetical protein
VLANMNYLIGPLPFIGSSPTAAVRFADAIEAVSR